MICDCGRNTYTRASFRKSDQPSCTCDAGTDMCLYRWTIGLSRLHMEREQCARASRTLLWVEAKGALDGRAGELLQLKRHTQAAPRPWVSFRTGGRGLTRCAYHLRFRHDGPWRFVYSISTAMWYDTWTVKPGMPDRYAW